MIGHSLRLHGGNRGRRLAPYDPNMGARALRGPGREVNVRPQIRLRQIVRDVIHARLLLRLAVPIVSG
jgi:hypothetical protein